MTRLVNEGSQDLTLLDEFEKNVEAVIGVLENSTSIIDQWSNDLPKFSGASCWTIPQRTRNDVFAILENFHPFADLLPEIQRFLITYVQQFESNVEKRYSDIIEKSKEIIGKCGQGPNNTPLNPAIPYQEMTELRRYIENLSQDLRFCVKTARERQQPQDKIDTGREQKTEESITDKEAFINFSKAIELSNGILTRKILEKAINKGVPVKVRASKPSKQRKIVHIQDVIVLINDLSSNEEATERAVKMFATLKEIDRKKRPHANLE